jgi:hypothetical protein
MAVVGRLDPVRRDSPDLTPREESVAFRGRIHSYEEIHYPFVCMKYQGFPERVTLSTRITERVPPDQGKGSNRAHGARGSLQGTFPGSTAPCWMEGQMIRSSYLMCTEPQTLDAQTPDAQIVAD